MAEPAAPPVLSDPPPPVPLDPASGGWKKLLLRGLLLVAMIGLLAWVFAVNRSLLREVASRGPRWELLLAAVGLLVLESFNLTVRWRILLAAVGVPLPFRSAYRMVAGSIVANLIMPGANGGDALKVALVAAATPARAKAIATLVLDRVIGLCGLLLVGSLAGAVSWSSAPETVRHLTLVSGGLSLATLAALVLMQARWLRPIGTRIARSHPALERIYEQLIEGLEALRQRPLAIPLAILLAMLGQTLNIGAFFLMTRSLRIDGGELSSFFVLVPFVFLSTAVPLPFGALGVTEGFSDQLFRWCGLEGGGLGMLGYRAAQAASLPILLAITALWTGTDSLRLGLFRWRTGQAGPPDEVRHGP